ncbi:MAG TPA: molybdopterin cofactor-binding domain-containing protein [Longimicrobiales bacterium]|nr:molybdopterin cofactor-binding domain-containing protein [Longimicrobiales bacterium]
MTTRRDFLRISGMGIIVLYTMDIRELIARRTLQFRDYPKDFNAYLRIGEDGRVTFFTGKIEMGQGVYTSLPQMLAEELDVPLSMVDPVLGDTDLCPWDMGTFGSMSTRFFGPPMRQAAAEAKAVLKELGSERLGVPVSRLGTRDGTVYDTREPSASVTYAELARGRRIERTVRGEVSRDEPTGYTVTGVDTHRMDGRLKVTGQALYSADVRPDGMLHAKVLRPQAHGSTLRAVDASGAEAVEGARVVRDGDLIAALHVHPDVAAEALAGLRATWEPPRGGPSTENIFDHLEGNVPEARVVTEAGDLAAGRAAAARVIESTFRAQYIAHAPMEPHAAVARVEGDGATVWASTQNPFTLRREVAEILDCPEENVHVITPFVGGGFGGKTENQQAHEAVRLSRASGSPVLVAWTREEEFFNDHFRPATIVHVASGVDANGAIAFWDYRNLHGGNRSSEPVYHIAHHRVTSAGGWGGEGPRYHPLRVGAWRGPGANVNHFAMESQIDLMAEAAGVDPLSFRRANLTDERVKRVLDAAAELFGHEWRPAPSGRGHGIALGSDAGAIVATMAEVEVDERSGEVRVLRMVCAQDMGEIINPEGARMQMEGGLIQGLGYALREEIRFDNGVIVDRNFDSYFIPRFSWLPKIEVTLVANPDLGPQGGGEPSVTTVGAVVANAVHDAIGHRVYELPMTPGRVKSAAGRGAAARG